MDRVDYLMYLLCKSSEYNGTIFKDILMASV